MELAEFGVLAEVRGLGVLPDERPLGLAGVVGGLLTALGATKRGVASTGLGEVGKSRVILDVDEL